MCTLTYSRKTVNSDIEHAHTKIAFGGNKACQAKPNTSGVKMDAMSEEITVSPMSANVSLGSAGKGSKLDKFLHDCH